MFYLLFFVYFSRAVGAAARVWVMLAMWFPFLEVGGVHTQVQPLRYVGVCSAVWVGLSILQGISPNCYWPTQEEAHVIWAGGVSDVSGDRPSQCRPRPSERVVGFTPCHPPTEAHCRLCMYIGDPLCGRMFIGHRQLCDLPLVPLHLKLHAIY